MMCFAIRHIAIILSPRRPAFPRRALKHCDKKNPTRGAVLQLLEIVLDDIEEIEDLEAVVFGQLVCDSGGGVGDEEMSFCVSICTFVPASALEFVLLY